MKLKKVLAVGLTVALSASVICTSFANSSVIAAENPNPNAAKYGIDAVRDSLNLVWEDDFGGEIGQGQPKEALITTNGFDENGNPTSDEVRSKAKWSHERNSDGSPITRNNQLQLYVGEDGRNSWTEDGVLHIRGQREEGEGYYDPIEKKYYRWTADGLNSAYFEDGETHRQAFRFGMMEAKVYTVNGAAKVDENGNPVYDKDGNIQQDPATSQGLWNGFWTCGNADMSEKTSAISFHESVFGWPYNGEIDICEAYNDSTQFKTYDYSKQDTLKDENGVIFNFNNGQYYIKHDRNGKTLITDGSGTVCVSFDTDQQSYVVAEGKSDFRLLTDDDGSQYIRMKNAYDIKQEKNSKGVMRNYVLDKNKKTVVDTDGNCYGGASKATAQFHHNTGNRINPNLDTSSKIEEIAGAKKDEHSSSPEAGYITNNGGTGDTTIGDSGYHVYGVYWTPTQMVYYVDNMITGVFDISAPEYRALRECPQYAILTFPIGGSMPGSPNPALQYAEYLVDYVRIYQADDSGYGNTNSLDYHGSKGFPALNELEKGFDEENYRVDMTYYEPVIEAYSHINIIPVGNESEVELTGECSKQDWRSSPLRSSQTCINVKNTAKFTTKKFFDEGKYDIYVQGISLDTVNDYSVTLNGSDIGSQLKMYSDHLNDKFGRTYAGMADAYAGTAEIVNGKHNISLSLAKINQSNTNSNSSTIRAIIAVGNSQNTATVEIDQDSYLVPTTTFSSESKVIYDNFYMTYDPNTNGNYHIPNVGGASFKNHAVKYDASSKNNLFLENRSQLATNPGGETDLRIIWDDHPPYDLKSGTYKLVAFVASNGTNGKFSFTQFEDGNVSGTNGNLIGTVDFTNTSPLAVYDNGTAKAYEIGEFTIVNGDTDRTAFTFAPAADGSNLTLHGLAAVPVSNDEPTTSATEQTTAETSTAAPDTTTTAVTTTKEPTTSTTTTTITTTTAAPTTTEPITAGPTVPSTSETTAATTTTTEPITSTTEAPTTMTTTVPTTVSFKIDIKNDDTLGKVEQTQNADGTITLKMNFASSSHSDIEWVIEGEYEIINEDMTSGVITIMPLSDLKVSAKQAVLYGDANSDGKVTAADVLLIRKSIAGQNVNLNNDASDVNCDGKLTAADVLMIRKYIAGQDIVLGK